MFDQVLGGVPTPLKLFIALAVVIALIVVAAWLTKRFGGQRLGAAALSGRSRQPRLGVLDVLAVDGRRRLVIVRRDNVEHLVMIGGPNDLVVESGILRVPANAPAQREPQLGPVAPEPV
ncbi:MAG: flagellar biosynthetic protein FliO, partial [Hansschlegelia sp.]